MMYDNACCTCARELSKIIPQYDEKTEKPTAQDRKLECCERIICGNCITNNRRFATYCPFCQVSTAPSSLPQGLNEPPAYSDPPSSRRSNALSTSTNDADPPAYSTINPLVPSKEKEEAVQQPSEDVLHFLDPSQDTIPSIALKYGVPQDALRRKNGLFADHLLAARKTVLIPGEFYKGGISLSPQPVEGEEEEKRKAKVRRWMVACKVSDYDVALLYLEQTKYDLDMAVETYLEDEEWEKQHPIQGSGKGQKASRPRRRLFAGGGSLTGQL